MMSETRLFRRDDHDFPTTKATQQRLISAGRVEGEGPNRLPVHLHSPNGTADSRGLVSRLPAPQPGSPIVPDGPSIPLGETDRGPSTSISTACWPAAGSSRDHRAPARAPRSGT